VQLSGQNYHFCGRRSSGAVVCWDAAGYTSNGESASPPGTYVLISAGRSYSCGIKSSGSLHCWGSGASSHTLPSGSFKQVAAGASFGCALKTDGGIACWGNDRDGQTNAPAGTFSVVGAGVSHTCALDSGGKAHCWGSNTWGQTSVPATTFKDLFVGDYSACGLESTGKLTCWGMMAKSTLPTGYYASVNIGRSAICMLNNSSKAVCYYKRSSGPGTYDSAKMPSYAVQAAIGVYVGKEPGVYCVLTTRGTILCHGAVYAFPPYP
jgi:hypothetical protein